MRNLAYKIHVMNYVDEKFQFSNVNKKKCNPTSFLLQYSTDIFPFCNDKYQNFATLKKINNQNGKFNRKSE